MKQTIKETIASDLKVLLKEKNAESVLVLRGLLAAIQNEQIRIGKDQEMSGDNLIDVLGKEAKKRKDAIPLYQQGGRPEKAEQEMRELKIIEKYLPKQLTEEELIGIIKETIRKTNAQNTSDMGKVMGIVMNEAKGRTDGKIVKELVQKLLG